ncbi:MAG TPA: MarR family transcriptional regulator [Ktedonobacteraceae bacterium]
MHIDPNYNTGYWLFYTQRCVEYAFTNMLQKACAEQGKQYVVTPSQWGVLTLLPDGITIGTISQQRGVDAPTITGIIKRLEQSGLVERRHDREDRRVVKVYLTPEGASITALLHPRVATFNEEMLRGFAEEERDLLLQNLQRIISNLTDAAGETGDRFKLLPVRIDA